MACRELSAGHDQLPELRVDQGGGSRWQGEQRGSCRNHQTPFPEDAMRSYLYKIPRNEKRLARDLEVVG